MAVTGANPWLSRTSRRSAAGERQASTTKPSLTASRCCQRRFDQVTDLDEGNAQGAGGPQEAQPNGQSSSSSGAEQQRDGASSSFLRGEGEAVEAYARRVFQRVFCEDIQSVLQMEVRVLHPVPLAEGRRLQRPGRAGATNSGSADVPESAPASLAAVVAVKARAGSPQP